MNAQLSTGPKTEEGKAASSKNHLSHGLTYRGGMFVLLPWENADEYQELLLDLKIEYGPKSRTEMILVERMAQHHWLRDRAGLLQSNCFLDDGTIDEKRFTLYMRYQTTHERAFHKCLNDLLRLRAEKRKVEIGFESQKRKQEEHDRKQEQHLGLSPFLAQRVKAQNSSNGEFESWGYRAGSSRRSSRLRHCGS